MEKAFSLSRSNLCMIHDLYMDKFRDDMFKIMDKEKAAQIESEVVTTYIKKMMARGRGYECSVNIGHYFTYSITMGELVDKLLKVDSAESAESEDVS